jgi:hypothetical protein
MARCGSCGFEASVRTDGTCSVCKKKFVGYLVTDRFIRVAAAAFVCNAEEFVIALSEEKKLSLDDVRDLLYFARDVLFLSVLRDDSTAFLIQDAKVVQKVWKQITATRAVGRSELLKMFWILADFAPSENPLDRLVQFEVRVFQGKLASSSDP